MDSSPTNSTGNKPTWARFGIKGLLLFVLLVGAVLGGWASQQQKVKTLQSELTIYRHRLNELKALVELASMERVAIEAAAGESKQVREFVKAFPNYHLREFAPTTRNETGRWEYRAPLVGPFFVVLSIQIDLLEHKLVRMPTPLQNIQYSIAEETTLTAPAGLSVTKLVTTHVLTQAEYERLIASPKDVSVLNLEVDRQTAIEQLSRLFPSVDWEDTTKR